MNVKDIIFELIRYRRMLEKQGVQVNAEVFDSAISALVGSKWVPCRETVDIPDYEVIACNGHGDMVIGYLYYKDEQWMCESDSEILLGAVAWRDLPETYKGD